MSYIDQDPFLPAGLLPRILIVEDEAPLRESLVQYLNGHDFLATGVSSQAEILDALAADHPDLILLDINLGEDDGLRVLRFLRMRNALPVILMTGHLRDEIDRVIGLEMGADDYLLKPFEMRELLARVRANLRRRLSERSASPLSGGRRYAFDGWILDQRNRTLSEPTKGSVALTKSEFALLNTFVNAPRHPFSRQQLLQTLRVHDDIADRAIDVLILRLRRKLERGTDVARLIRTERGVGYVFDADVVAA